MIAVQAQKEVDGLKKKILDLETKLKALTSDKQQALQVCHVYYNTCYLSTAHYVIAKFAVNDYNIHSAVLREGYTISSRMPPLNACRTKPP